MSYSDPNREFYTFSHDFGAATEIRSIRGPDGKVGKVIDIIVSATETFADGTGNIKLGDGSDDDEYALFVIGTLADTDSVRASSGSDPDWLIDPDIPADTQVEVTFTQPGAGAQTGIATVVIIIDWSW